MTFTTPLVNVEEEASLISKAQPFELRVRLNVNNSYFTKHYNILLDKCDEANTVRSRRRSYAFAANNVLISLMLSKAPYFRFPSSTSNRTEDQFFAEGLTISALKKVIDSATALGWVRQLHYKTEIAPSYQGRGQSRVRVSKQCPQLPSGTEVIRDISEVNFLHRKVDKNKPGTLSHRYSEADQASDQDLLFRYNTLLSENNLSLGDEPINLPSLLYRGYTVCSNQGLRNGRFWGGVWQGMNKTKRQQLRLNEEELIELDYKSMYPRAAYHLAEVIPPDDLYDLGDFDRDLAKTLTNICFNVSSRGRHRPIKAALFGNGWMDSVSPEEATEGYNHVVALIENKHHAISNHLFKPMFGAQLMWMESMITRRIINYFTLRGHCVLPIHDSYLVTKNLETLLFQHMEGHYKAVFNNIPIIVKV